MILLDVEMPGMDGVETARLIRARERSRETPIVFVTAHDADDARIAEAYSVGAVDYLLKPIRPEILKAKVTTFVQLAEQQQQAAARRAAEQARSILESITDAFFALNRDWRFTYVNQRAEVLLGQSREHLLGESIWEALAPAVGTEFHHAHLRAAAENVTVTAEVFYAPHERWYELHVYPSPDGLSVYFRDVTGRKQAEELLRASEEQRRLALDLAELGSWHVDPATMELTTDERFRSIFGTTSEQIDYEHAVAAIHPEDQPRVRDAVAAATRPDDPEPYAVEHRVVYPDGSIHWVFAKGRANFGGNGSARRPVTFDGTVADITERKRAEEQLRESEARFRQLADVMPQIVWTAEPDGTLDYYNRRWFEYVGLPPDAIDEARWDRYLHPDDLQTTYDTWTEFAALRKALRARVPREGR